MLESIFRIIKLLVYLPYKRLLIFVVSIAMIVIGISLYGAQGIVDGIFYFILALVGILSVTFGLVIVLYLINEKHKESSG